MVSDAKLKANRENALKGGRPVSYVTLQAQKSREIIVKALESQLAPIIKKAVQQARKGDRFAREWLMERGYGKVAQTIASDPENPLTVKLEISETIAKKNNIK